MINNKKVIAIIPARGGSKGIPRKNIKVLLGKPLLFWSIKAAKESKYVDRIIVSTEDSEIAEVSRCFGAEVLSRPKNLAADTATTISVLKHVIEKIPEADIVVLLQPTSPVRTGGLIDKAIEKFIKSRADTLATGYICRDYEWGTVNNLPRQKLKGWFYDDGNIYIHRKDYLERGKWFGKKLEKMIIGKVYNFEIDDEIDFFIIEALMENYLKINE
ncbi:MAG: acylneuraminate cytidylyltransferase family protein [Patescibacteria group bacterium]